MSEQRRETVPRSHVVDENELEAERNELSFEIDDRPHRAGDEAYETELDDSPGRSRRAGLTNAALPDEGPTDDDVTPETMLNADGARSPNEQGPDTPADQEYRIVGAGEIGAGTGLDEAEMARAKPYDGKRWDGEAD